jgi:predicted dehydrogenase
MGSHHLRLLAALPSADLVGLYDANRDRATAVAARFGCESLGSLDELVARAQAVVIATPTATHAELGCALLTAGLHVLVEKPLAGSLAEADKLVQAAGDRVLAVGHVEFHNPAVQSLLALGLPPGFVEVHRLGAFSARSLDIDVVLDLMIHDLQILHSLDPSPVRYLHAVGINVLTPKVDIANVRIELESGCVANLTASRVSADKIRKLRVFCAAGYYSVDYSRQVVEGYRLDTTAEPRQVVRADLAVDQTEPLARELAAFVRACRGEREVEIVDGIAGRRALHTALRVAADLETRAAGRAAIEPLLDGS